MYLLFMNVFEHIRPFRTHFLLVLYFRMRECIEPRSVLLKSINEPCYQIVCILRVFAFCLLVSISI